MSALANGLRAIYRFFGGDPILLGGVALAFLVGWWSAASVGRLAGAVAFVLFILAGLALTLARELRSNR